MKVCIDAKVFVSHLLNPLGNRLPTLVLDAFFEGRFELVVNETTIGELLMRTASKPYLRSRIDPNDVQSFIRLLRGSATIVPEIEAPIPSIARDVKGDYLIAHAVIEGADLLIPGDKDLLVIGTVGGVRIVSPASFVRLLDMGLE
ncbi:MAG: putative toxin-antitoxin system toxin component, PIN family [Thermomicrobiales bacterium]